MPASEPVIWIIQQSLQTDLQNIVAGSAYYYTAEDVANRSNERQEFNHSQFIVGLTDVTREIDETHTKYYYTATFHVSATIKPAPPTYEVADDLVRARLWSDVQKAVMADPHRTVSGTEYAIDTEVLAPDIQDQYDERVGITCPVVVHYRTLITDPAST